LASDLPEIETIIVEVPNSFHPFGVRGVGETGIVPPLAAVGTAVSEAIGLPVTSLPCSPPKLLKMIMEQG
jgi:CO/xanthine dehydrogenase Mo-binding subunit